MEGNLKSLQGLLYRLITAPEGVGAAIRSEPALSASGIEAIVRGDEHLNPVGRVGIYATAYFYRLLDCLKEDYPATLAVLGAESFQRLVADYLAEYPPTEASIFYAGQHLADFAAAHSVSREWPFIEDLARLERTTIEVFHGPDAVPLDTETMQTISPDRWPTFELRLHPAVKFLDVKWKVSEVLQAVNENRRWQVPVHETSRIVVFRQNAEVYFRELETGERRALECACRTVKFADICEKIAAEATADEPAGEISRLLQRWLSDGILVAASG
jgi:putative DNA-binding protein